MRAIVGLGNPGIEYDGTRHNVGFAAMDAICEKFECSCKKMKFEAFMGDAVIGKKRVLLLKPLTYMNNSGRAVLAAAQFYKIPLENILVMYDDISLDPGTVRIRRQGSAGGHNGIKSILAQIGTDTFKRIKIGVGEKPKGYDLADYVLGHFSVAENKEMDAACEKAIEAISLLVKEEVDMAMNRFN